MVLSWGLALLAFLPLVSAFTWWLPSESGMRTVAVLMYVAALATGAVVVRMSTSAATFRLTGWSLVSLVLAAAFSLILPAGTFLLLALWAIALLVWLGVIWPAIARSSSLLVAVLLVAVTLSGFLTAVTFLTVVGSAVTDRVMARAADRTELGRLTLGPFLYLIAVVAISLTSLPFAFWPWTAIRSEIVRELATDDRTARAQQRTACPDRDYHLREFRHPLFLFFIRIELSGYGGGPATHTCRLFFNDGRFAVADVRAPKLFTYVED